MDKSIRFQRNVYVILVCILVFAIITQIARSSMILKLASNKELVDKAEWIQLQEQSQHITMLGNLGETEGQHCILIDSTDELSMDMYDNFQQVYRYIKQPYAVQDVLKDTLSFTSCSAVVVTSSIEKLGSYIEEIEGYVENGGYYFQARIDHPGTVLTQMYRKLGIVNFWYVIGSEDIHFTSNLLIGQEGELFTDDYFYNDSLLLELDHTSEVFAQGKNKTPLVWKAEYGKGAFMVYNGNNLGMKSNRGLVVGAISMLIPNYIYPIFNSKLFYIDDYPAPMSTEIDNNIYAEYERNIATFFKDIWWPDMIQASRNYDVKYTAVAIQDYNEDVEYPFEDVNNEELTNLIVYGREVLKSGGEIGIHGYNHQPLQFRQEVADHLDYKVWRSIEDIEASVRQIVDYLEKAFPNYKAVSYVPPSNVLSLEGRQALIDNWPDFRVVASLYEEDPLGYAYVQEFEIAEDGVLEMPRITSGYFDAPDTKWLEANVMTSLGIISHFIHPDDIFDTHRSGDKSWSEMYKDFEAMLSRMESTYPWLRPQTSSEAAVSMGYVLNSQMKRNSTENKVDVQLDNQVITQYFIMRTDKRIGQLKNCEVTKIEENTYLVAADSEHFTIELK